MSKKTKKAMSMLLVVALIAVIAIGGMLAYLTSEDSDVNVMTLGNVKIEQIEQERDVNGDLADFTQAKPAFPVVGPIEWAEEGIELNGKDYKMFTDDPKNVIDKIITVKNTGLSDAYVRTIVAIEAPDYDAKDLIHVNVNGAISQTPWQGVDINGVQYVYCVFTYPEALKPGEVSAPSLLQVFLDCATENEDVERLGNTWEILTLSQACQVAGFEENPLTRSTESSAQYALDTAFGVANNENIAKWLGDSSIPCVVSSEEEFIQVLSDIKARAKAQIPGAEGNKSYREHIDIILADDIVIDGNTEFMYTDGNGSAIHFYGVEGTLDLNGHDIIVKQDALLEGKTYANAALLFQYSNVDIIGDGKIVTENKSIPIYGWANGTVNIYGGTYITNAYERNESAVYVNNQSMVINVYGGNYEKSGYAFNASDSCGSNPVIVLHEGVSYKKFLKNGTTDVTKSDIDAGRIQITEGCTLEEDVIDGVTWHQVVKE